MHPPARQAAAHRAIQPGMAGGKASADSGWPAPVQGGYGAPQCGQGACRLVHIFVPVLFYFDLKRGAVNPPVQPTPSFHAGPAPEKA